MFIRFKIALVFFAFQGLTFIAQSQAQSCYQAFHDATANLRPSTTSEKVDIYAGRTSQRADRDSEMNNPLLKWDQISIHDKEAQRLQKLLAQELYSSVDIQAFDHTAYGVVDLKVVNNGQTMIALISRDAISPSHREASEKDGLGFSRVMLVAFSIEKYLKLSQTTSQPGISPTAARHQAIESAILDRIAVNVPQEGEYLLSLSQARVSQDQNLFVHVKRTDSNSVSTERFELPLGPNQFRIFRQL